MPNYRERPQIRRLIEARGWRLATGPQNAGCAINPDGEIVRVSDGILKQLRKMEQEACEAGFTFPDAVARFCGDQ